MGCGASVNRVGKQFEGHEAKTPSQVVTKAGGNLQMIVGRVAAADKIIMPPFGQDDAVAINVRVFKIPPGSGTKKDEFKFSGFSAVDFKILDPDGGEVFVNMKRPGTWKFDMLGTHVAWNVARDSQKGGMVSGGTGKFQYDSQEFKPNAEAFWKEFSGDKDPLEGVSDMAQGSGANGVTVATGTAEYGAIGFVMRKARETSIKVGDAVAVLGTVRADDNGMIILEGGEETLITNCPQHLQRLQDVPTFDVPKPSASVSHLPMSNDLAKCWLE